MKTCRVVPNDAKSKDRLQKLKVLGISYSKKTTPPNLVISGKTERSVNGFISLDQNKQIEAPEQRRNRLLSEAKQKRQKLLEMYEAFSLKQESIEVKNEVTKVVLNKRNPLKYINKKLEQTRGKVKEIIQLNPSQANTYLANIKYTLEPVLMEVSKFLLESRALIQVENPSLLNVKVTGKDKSLFNKGIDAFSGLVDIPRVAGSITISPTKTIGARSSYRDSSKTVTMGNDDIGTLVHEMGHWLEYSVPGVREEVIAFYNKRTAGEKAVKMNRVTKGNVYRDNEITKVDKFVTPYIGKVYPDKGTEILSMGLELMYRNPVYLAKNDPEMFDFIYTVVRRK